MSHGTVEIDPEPVDHTRDRLARNAEAARDLSDFADANVRDAIRNVELAKLAAAGAQARYDAARAALRAHPKGRS